MKPFFLIILPVLISTGNSLQANAQSNFNKFLTPVDTFNKPRVITVAATWSGIYAGTLIGLNQTWYADYPHSSFHFFNDNAEWLQMDKAGHAYTTYFESVWSTQAFEWSGMNPKKAAWLGGATGFVFQSSLELLDGFSEEWGASSGDILANAAGSALCISQQLLWHEQRIHLKWSAHPVQYSEELTSRVDDLFGDSFPEKTLKDYNGQTYWLSVNPSSFIKSEHSRFPKWLNVSAGYGAQGMLGGFENTWEENAEVIDRSDTYRIRQFYLSLDADLTRIKTHSAILKTVFSIVNVIKIPAPALEINSDGKMKFYPLYF